MEHSKTRKLTELRAKTDRQLTILIASLLERGLSDEAERLLSVLSAPERNQLECQLTRLKTVAA